VGWYELLATLVVVVSPVAVVVVLGGAVALVRDAIERVPAIGFTGLALTLVAAGNLLVERRCGLSVNRPIVTVVVGPDPCRSGALAAVALVLLLTVLTAVATLVRR